MTRTIFGRRQVLLRQRARQDAWNRALREDGVLISWVHERPAAEVQASSRTEAGVGPDGEQARQAALD